MGLELEVVSKDERDLIQGRAELEALLTQQRSAQAASVRSPPSTSTPQDSSQVCLRSVQLSQLPALQSHDSLLALACNACVPTCMTASSLSPQAAGIPGRPMMICMCRTLV